MHWFQIAILGFAAFGLIGGVIQGDKKTIQVVLFAGIPLAVLALSAIIYNHFDDRNRKKKEDEEKLAAQQAFERQAAERQAAERASRDRLAEEQREIDRRNYAEQQRIEAERQRREAAEAARRKAEEDAFWNSPEGMKVRAAQHLAEIERQKAIDAANIRIMEQERIAEIAGKMRREEREEQENLINKVKDL